MHAFSEVVQIEDREVGRGRPTLIVAELGINHNAELALAVKMVEAAAAIGSDAVKLQTFRASEFVSDPTLTYTYTSEGKQITEPMLDMFRRVELSEEAHRAVFEAAHRLGLISFSTPVSVETADFLEGCDVPAFKVGSDDLTNRLLLENLAPRGRPLILSTGMSTLGEVEQALNWVSDAGARDVILLHCISSYPAAPEEANLRAIETLRRAFGCPVGFSDHTDGVLIAAMAVAAGACMVEKHFTLDRGLPGPDQRFSADPERFAELVSAIRVAEVAMGSGFKQPTPAEHEMRKIARRSIVAARDLSAGQILSREDLDVKRPGTGLPPADLPYLVGRRIRVPVAKDAQIHLEHFDMA